MRIQPLRMFRTPTLLLLMTAWGTSPAAAQSGAPARIAGAAPASTTSPQATLGFETFSRFDFLPGEKIVALDDFTPDTVGDSPGRWNTNASGEVVTVADTPGRWLNWRARVSTCQVESRKMAVSLPPASAAEVLKKLAEQEARLDNGEWEKVLRAGLQMESMARAAGDAESTRANDERYPADPSRIFVRRLRAFLDATADVNFSARTLRLTD